jgi:hypothetical protein
VAQQSSPAVSNQTPSEPDPCPGAAAGVPVKAPPNRFGPIGVPYPTPRAAAPAPRTAGGGHRPLVEAAVDGPALDEPAAPPCSAARISGITCRRAASAGRVGSTKLKTR